MEAEEEPFCFARFGGGLYHHHEGWVGDFLLGRATASSQCVHS